MEGVRFLNGCEAAAQDCVRRWIEQEGIPILEGWGVRDLREVALRPWRRLGGRGAYLQLKGLEGITGLYVSEIAPGAALEEERHLFEKVVYVVSGKGKIEIRQPGREPQTVDWREGSLFSPPLNTYHRIVNTGADRALMAAVTTAPLVFDHFHNERFVFDCDFTFSDRYDAEPNYFAPGEERWRQRSIPRCKRARA